MSVRSRMPRYGAEGAETQMTFFQEFFRIAADTGVNEVVIVAHHRGRLNLMIGLLKMPPELLFRKLLGKSEFPDHCKTVGDVISHLCPSSTLKIGDRKLNIQMTNVPSHLEAVCPVSLGQARALQQVLGDGDYSTQESNADQVLNVQIHGDAAFMGQGVSHESLLMSLLPHFSVGGSVHVIVNNQLGFTTPAHYGRGTRYASDLAKVISAPVFHVNGEYPEDVIRATRIACEYQRKFRKSSFIDLNCYRRRGHNELDDPTFTNPLIYNIISNKSTIPDLYVSQLVKSGLITEKDIEDIKNEYHAQLTAALENASNFIPPDPQRQLWTGYKPAPSAITTWDTGVDKDLLTIIGLSSVRVPNDFNVHPNILKNHITSRIQRIKNEGVIDWATAEALAFGSLIYNGFNVRISGQDVGRGTFSHRHAMMVDQRSDDVYIPLNHISEEQIGHLEIANSLLSEEAVLGFEYGFSNISPNTLVIWEAQFGDFFNGAQIQIDTYVTCGEAKWMTMSGLTMLLPHGYDGAGPEHSSCRLERFLQLSDSSEVRPDGEDVNIHIVNPTTPAQYFHLLRRQMVRNYRKPLIVVGPKILLRSPDAVSHLDDMGPNTSFKPVLDDESTADPSKVNRLIFTSGKHYYALKNYRNQNMISNVAIIRLEELSPFPTQQLRDQIAKYKNAKEFIWSQEEPRNMGAWSYCSSRFHNLVGCKVRFAGRDQAPCPAVGIGEIHKKEAQFVIEQPFK
uniref:Putative 2-oxoglutarate dehydrogenase E1 component DHKTD1, mitochondrial n=1 Tax=Lygus hesperus TaxID=30085 RepID=A0A0A9W5F4_LYGHE